MTCECYYGGCQFHASQTDPDSGPFCDEPFCRATPQELHKFGEQRAVYLKQVREQQGNTGVETINIVDEVQAQYQRVLDADGAKPSDRVQLPEKARAGIEVLHWAVESLLTTSRYVDEEGEATHALADLLSCIADPPFKLRADAGVQPSADALLRELLDALDGWNPGGNLHGRTLDQIAREDRLRRAKDQARTYVAGVRAWPKEQQPDGSVTSVDPADMSPAQRATLGVTGARNMSDGGAR